MRKTTTLALCAALVALPACASDDAHVPDHTDAVADVVTHAVDVPCTCGEADADLLGCACHECSSGAGNPENELCTCGAIAVHAVDDPRTQAVSFSDGEDALGVGRNSGKGPTILLRDGRKLRGHVVKELDDGIQVQVVTEGTIALTKVLYSNLHPRTLYRIKLGKLKKGDAVGHLDVADFAADHGMWDAARLHYLQASELDERLASDIDAKLLHLSENAAAKELARGVTAMDEASNVAAKRHFNRVLRDFPDSNAAEDAKAHLSALSEKAAGVAPGAFEGLDAAQTKKLEKVHEELGGARRKVQDGLAASKSRAQQKRDLGAAVSRAERARKSLEKMDDPALAQAVAAADAAAVETLVEAHLHLASIYTQQSDYKSARKHAQAALALDPGNSEARAILSRITDYEADSDDDWYGQRLGRYPIHRPRHRGGWRTGRGGFRGGGLRGGGGGLGGGGGRGR